MSELPAVFSNLIALTRKPAFVAGSSASGGDPCGVEPVAIGTGGGGFWRATQFCARFKATSAAPRPKASSRMADNVQTVAFRGVEDCSGGAARNNSVGFPQCGQSIVSPADSAGNSIWPPHSRHSPFRYLV